MDKKISFIKVYTQNDLYDSAEVTYEDSTEPKIIKGFDNVVSILSDFSMQERMLLEELISNKKVVLIEKNKKNTTKVVVTLIVASVLAAGSIYALSRQRKYTRDEKDVSKEVVMVTNTPMPKLTPTATPTIKPTITPTATPNPYRSIEKVETNAEPVVDNGSKYLENLEENYVEIDDLCLRIRAFNDGSERTKESFERIKDDISNKSMTNINELCQYVTGAKMTGDKYELSIQNSFDKDTMDYYVLDKFCSKRNEIIESAFTKNASSTKKLISNFLGELTDFIYQNKPLYNGNRWIYYRQLNNFTKLSLCDMYLFMLLPDVSYAAHINGSEWSKKTLMEEVQNYINNACQDIEASIGKTKKY